MKQHTLKTAITLKGIGLHSGNTVNVIIHPASEGHGIQFKRTDLPEQALIKADANNVFATDRHTVLGSETSNIATVEHLMAALIACGVDHALVEVDASELPIMDGSAAAFVAAIQASGLEPLEKDREYLELLEPLTIKDGDSEITLMPSDDLEMTVMVDFDSEVLSPQFATLNGYENFSTEIASSRTFVFLHELTALLENGLAKGGSPENAVVFVEKIPTEAQHQQLAKQFNVDINIDAPGLLPGTTTRYSNEAARHKLLDLVGDLALLGVPIKAKIFARKPGHGINTKLAETLRKLMIAQRKIKDIPSYDPTKEPLYDVNHICTKLHHRYPFLLIDKIIELSKDHVVSVKNVTVNEPFFPGHFPGNPIMPGVLQIEAMAQTGGILVMENIDDPHAYDTFFLKIDGARFRKIVVPGDTLLIRMDLTSPIRRGLVEMKGRAFVGNTLVAEADLLAQIIKRR